MSVHGNQLTNTVNNTISLGREDDALAVRTLVLVLEPKEILKYVSNIILHSSCVMIKMMFKAFASTYISGLNSECLRSF